MFTTCYLLISAYLLMLIVDFLYRTRSLWNRCQQNQTETIFLTDEQIDRLLAFQEEPQEPQEDQESDFQPQVESLTLRQIRSLFGSLREEGWNTPGVRSLRRDDGISWLRERASVSDANRRLIQSLVACQ